MQSIQTPNVLSHAIANFPIIYECGCLGTASWFVFKTLMHPCYFCVTHPGVIQGLRQSMLKGMTNMDTITSVNVHRRDHHVLNSLITRTHAQYSVA